jgi:DNA-directed RNA polymerase subunit RPC12/RpoP
MYFISPCYNCGNLLIIEEEQKTKRCPYCNRLLNLSKTRILRRVSTSREASRIVREMKLDKGCVSDKENLIEKE